MSELKFDIDKTVTMLRGTGVFDANYYMMMNEDVQKAQLDPLYHYVVAGEREGRAPCRLFDPRWYQTTYKMDPTTVNLFLHYLAKGERSGFKPSPLLDPVYIRTNYGLPETESALIHFLNKHQREGFNPNPAFDTREYLALYPDVANSTLPPYYHFIEYGIFEGRIPRNNFNWSYVRNAHGLIGDNLKIFRIFCEFAPSLDWKTNGVFQVEKLQGEIKNNQQPGEFYEEKPILTNNFSKTDIDVFAFYLPQFHKDINNDKWWGEGFTEWTNLSRGVPRYEGHYQPRIPAALGYYDLDNPEIIRKQASLAKGAGITGFGIYYYEFGNKNVLRKPLRMIRENADIDIKYFLIWANESWSRRWDGSESDVLAAQEYPKGFANKLAEDFCDYFADSRYYRMDERPFLVIYRAGHIPESKKFIKNLRKGCKARGFDPLIYVAQSFGDLDPLTYGADGALEFPPHKLSSSAHLVNSHKSLYNSSRDLKIFSYDELVSISINEPKPNYRLIKTAFPSWDNDARKQGNSNIVDGSTPVKFQHWVHELIKREISTKQKSPLVCINAWNEWGEGAYLEPDRHFGYAYLNAVGRSLTRTANFKRTNMILVGHDLYDAGAQRLLLEIGRQLRVTGCDIKFVIASKDHHSTELLQKYEAIGSVRFISDVMEGNSWDEFHQLLQNNGPAGYIFNTSVSGQWISVFPDDVKCNATLLVHEMSGMLKHSCDAKKLSEIAGNFSYIIFPAVIVRNQFEKFIGRKLSNASICPQGMYKHESDLVPHKNNEKNLRQFLDSDRKPLVVVGLGYADLRKGFDLFVGTCAELCRRNVDVLFVWQGNIHADFERWLMVDFEYLVEQKKLLIVPSNENVANIMAAADAYFLSSREDPFPSVALEAWHFGVPVYAFRGAGGISDLIQSEPKLGALVEGLSIVDAADKLSALGQDKPNSNKHSALSKFRVGYASQAHSFKTYVAKLASLNGVHPQVDICVLTYNHEDFTGERLKSILDQTALRSSVTVFDASSSDRSVQLVDAFNSQHSCDFKVVRTPTNGGYLPALWRAALEKTTSEFVWLAEGDDSSHPYFLDRCLEILRKDKTTGLVFTGIQRINEKGEALDTSIQTYIESILGEKWSTGGLFDGEEFLKSGATVTNPITNISAVIWRRSALVEALKVFEAVKGISFAFDWVLYVAMAQLGWKIAYTPELLSFHRIYKTSFSGELDIKKHISEIQSIYNIFDKISPLDISHRRITYLKDLAK